MTCNFIKTKIKMKKKLIRFSALKMFFQKRGTKGIRIDWEWHWYAGSLFDAVFGIGLDIHYVGVDQRCTEFWKSLILLGYDFNKRLDFHFNPKTMFSIHFISNFCFHFFFFFSNISIFHPCYSVDSSGDTARCIQWHYVFHSTKMG